MERACKKRIPMANFTYKSDQEPTFKEMWSLIF